MTNRGNTADKPRRNSGNQFSLATTETWKIIAERLRKKETEGVVRGGDSSYQPRLACKPELTKLIVLGGRKSLGTMRHLNWLNADKLQRYTQPPVTLSLYFPSPCLRFLFSPVLVTTIGRNHSDLRLSGGLNERMESSGRFFRGNFYALAIVKLSTSFLSRKRSLVARANASSGTFEYLSVSWVYSFLLISPIFSWREERVFLVRFCSSMRVTGKLRIVFRDLFRALQRERIYKEFLKRLRKKNRILKSFFLLPSISRH